MPVNVIAFHFPGLPQVGCAFQLRRDPVPELPASGGNISFAVRSDTAENVLAARRGLAARLHIERWAELRQVHGDGLLFDPEPIAVDAQPVA